MKTYTSSYTPAALVSLCAIRKVNTDDVEQALDAVLTGLDIRQEFTGLRSVKGEKGEHSAIIAGVARMPKGTVKDVLLWFCDIHAANKAAKRAGLIEPQLADFRPALQEWFMSFSEDAELAAKAAKEAQAAKAKEEAKEAIAETVKQVVKSKASKAAPVTA